MSFKQRLALAVNSVPRNPQYPYGEQAVKGEKK